MIRTEIPGEHTPDRVLIAGQLLQVREFDLKREKNYGNDFGFRDYIYNLNGLSEYFNYIRSLGGNNTVLDLGAGTTRAIAELESRDIGKGVNFIATVLRRQKSVSSNGIDSSRVFKTSAERLAGIPDNSVSGIISYSALAYSAVPELVIRSIDRVLIPGGVIKAEFNNDKTVTNPKSAYSNRKDYKKFVEELTRLGYDVAHEDWRGEVVLAIKPGGNLGVSAYDLLMADEAVGGLRVDRLKSLEDIVEEFRLALEEAARS